MENKKIKLNLGSHNKDISEEYINVDILDLPRVHLVGDISSTPWQFNVANKEKCAILTSNRNGLDAQFRLKDDEIDEIYFEECLEHISFHRTIAVLKECHRVLKRGGKMYIQVPDAGRAMEYYANGEICDCVPHKAHMKDPWMAFRAREDCPKCKGKGKIGPTRWLYTFLGQQKHEYDAHLNIFTKNILWRDLKGAGFDMNKAEWQDHPFKLRVNVYK